ncbi:MAG: hypothetical protein JXR58_09115 [Bacteroidales bacterium]|nr:hypothetical protein [Bacteroidales bacterium]
MKFIVCILSFFIFINLYGQKVNGKIVTEHGNLTLIKIWGTHQERGYAYGYLLSDKILEVHEKFIKPSFSAHYEFVRNILLEKSHLQVDEEYIEEAKAIIKGMTDKGVDIFKMDFVDILVANSFLDVMGLNRGSFLSGCSTLVSWGKATENTLENGQTVITRHLDWQPYEPLVNNQVVVVHIPSETDEQPWLSVGFAGQMSVLSGCNKNGVCVFQHDLTDPLQGTTKVGIKYEPIWFSLRSGIEKKDPNNDGKNNVLDVKHQLLKNEHGYVDGYIVVATANSTEENDSLIGLVAEITPGKPHFSFRDINFEDGLEGKNLYAANGSVKRNNKRNYCKRYLAVSKSIGKGEKISADKSWKIMRDKSVNETPNIHFMQFVPEKSVFKLSVYNLKMNAYEFEPIIFNLDELFTK